MPEIGILDASKKTAEIKLHNAYVYKEKSNLLSNRNEQHRKY